MQKKFVAIPQASTTLDENGNIVFDRTQMTMTATTFDEMRKGCWDRDERVKDLALNYTDGSLPFPTFPRFCGQTFYEGKDKELGLACVKANNDWMVEEWCAPSGGVNIPLCIIPLWDAELAADETKRNAERGVRAIAFSEMPTRLKLPSINTDYWDPLWQVCNDYGVTVCMHVGSSSSNPVASPDSNKAVGVTLGFNNAIASLGRLALLGQPPAVPQAEAGVLRGPDRVDPLHPRAGRHGVGDARRLDGRQGADPGAARRRSTTAASSGASPPIATGCARWKRWARTTSASRPTTRTPTRRGRIPRPTSRSCAPGSTTTWPTRSCGATPSGCWSSTGSDEVGTPDTLCSPAHLAPPPGAAPSGAAVDPAPQGQQGQ